MQIPIQISFRNMEPSEAIAARIRERAEHLEKFYDRIISCRVMVEAPHRHHQSGNLMHIRVDIRLPGRELVAGRSPNQKQAHKDVYVAIRDTFDAIERELQSFAQVQRREVKNHSQPGVPEIKGRAQPQPETEIPPEPEAQVSI